MGEESFIRILAELSNIATRSLSLAIDQWEGLHRELKAQFLRSSPSHAGDVLIKHGALIDEILASHSPICISVGSSQEGDVIHIADDAFSYDDLCRTFVCVYILLANSSPDPMVSTIEVLRIIRMADRTAFGFVGNQKMKFIRFIAEKTHRLRLKLSGSFRLGRYFHVENWDHIGPGGVLHFIAAHRSPLESIVKQISAESCFLSDSFGKAALSSVVFFFRSMLQADSRPWYSGWSIPHPMEDSDECPLNSSVSDM